KLRAAQARHYFALRALVPDDEGWPEGAIIKYQTGSTAAPMTGTKHDNGKPMLDLIPPLMELEVGAVLSFGAEKYSIDNWRQVPDLRRRYIAAAMRHINALRRGESVDPE